MYWSVTGRTSCQVSKKVDPVVRNRSRSPNRTNRSFLEVRRILENEPDKSP